MRRLMTVRAFVTAALITVARPLSAAPCVPYEPAVVTLSGTLVVQQAYGAPNYGGTPAQDTVERYYALQLDRPICVDTGHDTDVPEADVRVLQLVMGMLPSAPAGAHASVTGTLFHGISGHHHTPVLLSVRTIAR